MYQNVTKKLRYYFEINKKVIKRHNFCILYIINKGSVIIVWNQFKSKYFIVLLISII